MTDVDTVAELDVLRAEDQHALLEGRAFTEAREVLEGEAAAAVGRAGHGSAESRWSRRLALPATAVAGGLLAAVLGGATTFAQEPGTTQTTPTTTTTAPPAPVAHSVSLTAKLKIKPRKGAFVGTGTVAGKPFGKGRFRSRSVVERTSPLRIRTTLTATYKAGTIVLKGKGTYVGSTFKATVDVARGTGAYKKATGRKLKVTDRARNGMDTLKVKGKITYPES